VAGIAGRPADLAREKIAGRGGRKSVEPGWSTSQHLCGTAPMGQLFGDPLAVVDP